MAGRRTQRPRSSEQVSPPEVADKATSQALAELVAATRRLQAERSMQMIEVDLVVGSNAVNHSLGRAAKVAHVTPTVADATFAYALVKEHQLASKQALIEVVGVDQPGATLLLM